MEDMEGGCFQQAAVPVRRHLLLVVDTEQHAGGEAHHVLGSDVRSSCKESLQNLQTSHLCSMMERRPVALQGLDTQRRQL